jgi:GNAT superfamily N-acetyltransferase
MKVIDLPAEHEESYCQCLEEWSPDLREAGTLKREWFRRMKERGLRVKVAVDEHGTVGGMIQYAPVENVPVHGHDLYYVYCIWVHGHKQGRGNFQKKGMGTALLQAAEDDAKERGAKGLVAWGVSLPVFMRAAWFRKHGYRPVDRAGMMSLLWKRFDESGSAPAWVKVKKKPRPQEGKVTVTCLQSGWCPAQNLACERAKRAAIDLGERVVVHEIDTFERATAMEWGASDALFIDGREIRTGPPPSYEALRKTMERNLRRLPRPGRPG